MKTRIEVREGVAHLILDDAAEKVNTLGLGMLAELTRRFDELAADSSVLTVVVRSAKPGGFVAGANIKELQSLAFSPQAAMAGYEAVRVGQKLMNKIEDFPKPVIAAVHGAALGGGLELALACHARVVADDEATKLGLPELKLGIIPGFGGTYRLPKLMGLARAIQTILTSSNLDGKKALKSGLADALCPIEYLAEVAQKLALRLLDPAEKGRLVAKRRATLSLPMKLMELPILSGMVFSKARKGVLAKTQGNYPAPLKFLDHLSVNWGKAREPFLESEAKALGETLASPVSHQLMRIFFLGQAAKKQAGEAKPMKIGKLAIVGAGFMGSGIAISCLTRAKIPTLLKDLSEEELGRSLKKIWDSLSKRVQRRQLSPLDARAQFNLATPVTTDAGLRLADFVIEAVPEIMDLKKEIFSGLEGVLAPHAVIASNSSTLPIRDLADHARNPERFIGMHFFSPAEVMPLVEVIPGPRTSQDTIATVVNLALKMGKTPVVVGDSPGFLVNRILLPYVLEAVKMVDEGVPVEAVDAAALKFGMPVGPIKLMGEVGIEVMVKVFGILQSHFGDHLPKPAWINREDLDKAFARRRDGKMSVDVMMIQGWVAKSASSISEMDITDRLFHAMLNEAARCLEEGIVKEAGYLDLAMIYGTGFPPFRGGLLQEAESRGLENVINRGKVLAQRYGSWLQPPEALIKRKDGGFYS